MATTYAVEQEKAITPILAIVTRGVLDAELGTAYRITSTTAKFEGKSVMLDMIPNGSAQKDRFLWQEKRGYSLQ